MTDVVVIGAGALGAATAWWLARSGSSMVLLEEQSRRELRLATRGTAWSAHPSAHHDAALVRAVPCAQGHLAVGAASWSRAGDLRRHVRTWFPGFDPTAPEPVEPAAMSTASGEVTVVRTGPVVTATSGARGSVADIAVARQLAGVPLPAAGRRWRRAS